MNRTGKRFCAFFLIFVIMICIAGCGNSQGNNTSEQTAQNASKPEDRTDAETEAGTVEQGSPPAEQQDAQGSDNAEASGSDILVVYFSRTGEQYTVGVIDHGNTAIVAEMIAEETGADLFEVLPEDDHYPMTYAELTDVAKKEQNDKARPA